MDYILKKEVKKTSKKAAGSFAVWGIGAALLCCGGPLIFLAIASGGAVGLLGVLFSNVFFVAIGLFIMSLTIALFYMKVMKIKKSRNIKN